MSRQNKLDIQFHRLVQRIDEVVEGVFTGLRVQPYIGRNVGQDMVSG